MRHVMLGAYWNETCISFGEFATNIKKTLSTLREFDSTFSHFCHIAKGKDATHLIAEDFSNLSEILRESSSADDKIFSVVDENNMISDHATSKLGFREIFNTSRKLKDGGINISFCDGKHGEFSSSNLFLINFPDTRKADRHVLYLMQTKLKDLALLSISMFKPRSLRSGDQDFAYKISEEDITAINWLTYLSHLPPEQVPAKSELLGMGISWEAVPQGGTLFMLDQEMVSADNPEHVARGKLLRARLMEHGWIEN
ncbi:Imm52 family immunity protein [Massilia sp. W12]|uniref:Imm52 family immunity protein n=1 Tax=Massilia sp. W12 TaxID=3126507 RepID=UPI0030CD8724